MLCSEIVKYYFISSVVSPEIAGGDPSGLSGSLDPLCGNQGINLDNGQVGKSWIAFSVIFGSCVGPLS